jgi:hypothetical protein
VLRKDGEDKFGPIIEKRRDKGYYIDSQRGKEYPANNKKREG